MRKLGFILLIVLFSLSACRKGRGLNRIIRHANRAFDSKEEKQTESYVIEYDMQVLSKTELPDSGDFKCYSVKIRLPKDTTNYFPMIKVFLPGGIGIDDIRYAKVNVDFFLHDDIVNKYNSTTWAYNNGFPMKYPQK